LKRELKDFARDKGTDLFGIAGKECFGRLPGVKPDELLPGANSVIVLGVRRNWYVLKHKPSWHHSEWYIGSLAERFFIVDRVAAFLEDRGIEAFPVAGHAVFSPRGTALEKAIGKLSITEEGEIVGAEAFTRAYFESHKCLSYIRLGEEAGLGEVGRCSMLITPDFGPRVTLAAVITTAELEPDRKLSEQVCMRDACSKCVEMCQSGAIKPYGYNLVKCMIKLGILSVELLKKRDPEEIQRRIMLSKKEVLVGGVAGGGCGVCMLACPVGRIKFSPATPSGFLKSMLMEPLTASELMPTQPVERKRRV